MKVYRGPKSTDFLHESHVAVDTVTASELEDGIGKNSQIRVNISKEGYDRQAVCTLEFDDGDILPMIRGLLTRLAVQEDRLAKIKKIVGNSKSDTDKVMSIKKFFK